MQPSADRARRIAIAVLFFCCTTGRVSAAEPEEAAPRSRFHLDVGWPDGITYEFRKVSPALADEKLLHYFSDVYVLGRIGARFDVDFAAFDADGGLMDFQDDVAVRRARFYLTGDFSLGLPLAYKFEMSVEGRQVFLNDFYLRWKPSRWVDSVDFGYLTPPMGLENVVNSRSLTFMEIAAPVQALAPGFRSGIAAAGHGDAWRLAWKLGLYSAGQQQVAGDASDTSAQIVGRTAWVPWRESAEAGDAFVHLGASLSYVDSGDNGVRYRARPESFIAPFVVDTDEIDASGAFQTAFEGAWVDGPLLVSGEVLHSSVFSDEAGDPDFYGFYGLVALVLTGETHPYDTRTGLFQRLQPSKPFSIRDRGFGAVEIGQRLAWLDLHDASVRGGEMLTLSSGVAWHLDTELRLFADYVFAHVDRGPERGDVHVFQARIEIGI